VHAQNLAVNPGFENGNTSGWFAFGPPVISVQTTQVHSGTYGALVQGRTGTWNGIAQSMASIMQSGQSYNISAFVRLASGTNQTVQLTMAKTDANGSQYAGVASGSVSSTAWSQLSGQYTYNLSGTLTGLTLYVEVPSSATADTLVDDLSVQLVSSGSSQPTNGAATVNWYNVRQKIEGFGASSAWRSSWNSSVADMFFSTNTGIGLSLLRTRIAPGATTVENSIMQLARDRGARVWSSPWSPQTSFKTPNQNGVLSVNGGGFAGTPANYQAYANQLAGYVVNMKNTYGINLYALSIQNEPDYNTTNYESCVWTAQQIHDFVPFLSASLIASNAGSTKIILPESESWGSGPGLYSTTMADPSVAPLVGILANHNYVSDNNAGDKTVPAALPAYGKSLWETEVSTFSSYDGGITNAIYWAGRIHGFLTVAEVNAWHYWWLSATGPDNSGLASNADVLAKRGYVLGQYSRFVRPDYLRLGVVTNSGPALVSAFRHPLTASFAIVAVNPNAGSVTQTFTLNNVSGVTNVTPWLTSATLSLASQPAVSLTNSVFAYQLPAMSVVTFVGQAVPTPPTLAIQLVAPGQLRATFNGNVGPAYNLLATSNFTSWTTVLSTNPTALPITVSLGTTGAPQQFYRLQLTP
jgi:glucuronoarabinoxylan endo-1,4-beta-xylanase